MDDQPLSGRERQKLLTRARVVDAARALFAEKGYEQATIRDIAARAGVAPGSVFTTFSSKSELLLEIVFTKYMTLAEALSDTVDHTGDPVEQLTLLARLAYGYELQEPRLLAETIGASWTWTPKEDFENRRRLQPLTSRIEQILHNAQTAGRLPAHMDCAMLGDIVFAIYTRNFRRALFDGEDAPTLAARFKAQMELVLS